MVGKCWIISPSSHPSVHVSGRLEAPKLAKTRCRHDFQWKSRYDVSNFGPLDVHNLEFIYIVGGFNPIEKYQSNWIMSPSIRGKNRKYLKPQTSYGVFSFFPWVPNSHPLISIQSHQVHIQHHRTTHEYFLSSSSTWGGSTRCGSSQDRSPHS